MNESENAVVNLVQQKLEEMILHSESVDLTDKNKLLVLTVDEDLTVQSYEALQTLAIKVADKFGVTGVIVQSSVKVASRPKIVCLCGSTRFYKQFMEQNYRETMAGKIVLSVGFYSHADNEVHGESIGITPEQKVELDELHKRKIDLADEILVLNVGGYIGESTGSEIEYAQNHGKGIRYLEEVKQ
jgi:hypothetical protein